MQREKEKKVLKECVNIKIKVAFLLSVSLLETYPAIAAPIGIVIGMMGVIAGLTITVPSTNGANPGRNL